MAAYTCSSKMDRNVKTKWLAALRSGKYKQTRGQLARTDDNGKPLSFCCLGVLCDVVDPKYNQYGATGIPDYGILNKAKLHNSALDPLTNLNDRGHKNFKYIANWIEKNL